MQGLAQKLAHRQKLEQKQVQIQKQILKSEMVQLTTLALEQRVKAELEENRFLEAIEDELETEESVQKETATDADNSEDEKIPAKETAADDKEVDWDAFLNDSDHFEYRRSYHGEITNDMPQPDTLTLSDHLYEQVRMESFSESETAIAEEIVGNINRNGYLDVSLEEISLMSGSLFETVKSTHNRITRFDPVGIASLDLRNCLMVQLEHRYPDDNITFRILDEYWDDFANRRYEALADTLDVGMDSIRDSFEVVTRLNPRPGEGYFDEKQNYIIPDLIVTQIGKEFEIYLNDGSMPNFRINTAYRDMYLHKEKTDKKVKEFLSKKLESARWFLAAVHQRRTTMVRTMRAILERQRAFFNKGPEYLKPMILDHIAGDIEMDISTISRVTRDKYVQTDWGVFELKYFFSEKMTTNSGDEVSNRIIKQQLSDLIDSENKQKPYSDSSLTQLLVERGFQIKRRTIAKYREQLQIPVQRLRREI